MAARITMQQVAAQAGVSKAAVSRALGDGPCDLAADTRARIRAAAAALGYAAPPRRSPAGRRLAVVVRTAGGAPAALAAALVAAVRADGGEAAVIQAAHGGAAAERALLGGGFAGLLLAEPLPARLAASAAVRRLPAVAIDQEGDGPGCDDAGGAGLGVAHLAARGFAPLVYLQCGSHAPHASLARRRAGYEAAVRARGQEPLVLALPVAAAAARLATLPGRPGVLAYNASDGAWLMAELRRRALAVPAAIGVLCFDDDERVQLLGLSCLRLPLAALAERAVARLRARLACWPASPPPEPPEPPLPCTLVPRAST